MQQVGDNLTSAWLLRPCPFLFCCSPFGKGISAGFLSNSSRRGPSPNQSWHPDLGLPAFRLWEICIVYKPPSLYFVIAVWMDWDRRTCEFYLNIPYIKQIERLTLLDSPWMVGGLVTMLMASLSALLPCFWKTSSQPLLIDLHRQGSQCYLMISHTVTERYLNSKEE